MRHIIIQSALEQAERLFNLYVADVVDLEVEDAYLERVLKLYDETCKELKEYGVEGVRINGIFRDLNKI